MDHNLGMQNIKSHYTSAYNIDQYNKCNEST